MFLENKLKISFFYYLFSIITIIFIFSYGNLNSFEKSKIDLIFFILVFIISVFIAELRNNIFLKILIFYIFVFYILRIIPCIIYFDGQFFINRNVYGIEIKKAIHQLIVQYIFMFSSLLIVRPNFNFFKLTKTSIENLKLINFMMKLILIIMLCNLLFNLFGVIDYNSYQKYLAVFFNIFNSKRLSIVFTILVFLVIYKKYEIKYFYLKLFTFYAFYIYDTVFLAGSRSAIIHLILTIFLLFLLILNFNEMKIKQLFFTIFIIPIIQFSFFIGTLIKNLDTQKTMRETGFDVRRGFQTSTDSDIVISFLHETNSVIVRGLSERMAYFDFYIEKVSNGFIYEKIVNFAYYSKSIIDRISPGIDFFNVPLAAKILQRTYFDSTVPLRKLDNPLNIVNFTNSEQITIFAEMQILFSYYSVIFYLILFFILKLLIKNLDNFKDINYQITAIFIITSFFDWLTGFGFDFFMVQTFYSIFFLIILLSISKLYKFIKK